MLCLDVLQIYASATGDRVWDEGTQQILGTVDGKTRGLSMRMARARKCLASVFDMCLVRHRVVFDSAEDGADLLREENKEGGEKTTFKPVL